ncbi:MAG: ubiquitin-like domain-containing protein, partial [Promethearchaeia archaeon]
MDEDSDEVAGITVPVTIQSTCFGRNDFFNVSVEPTMLVKDLKRELYANFSSQVCDSEQMELWWAGKELKGLSSDSLRSYGFGRELTRIL